MLPALLQFSASNFWKDCIKYNATVTQYIGELARYLLAGEANPLDKQHNVRIAVGNGMRPEIWGEFQVCANTAIVQQLEESPTAINAQILRRGSTFLRLANFTEVSLRFG